MKNKKFLLGGLLLLGVGFATVTATLYISGTVNIKKDEEGFKKQVVFKTVKLNDATSDDAKIIDDGKKIQFTISSLKSIGDVATIKYTIENTSQFNARIRELTCTPVAPVVSTDPTADKYLSLIASNTLNGTLLKKDDIASTTDVVENVSAEDTITIKMIRSYVGEEGVTAPETKAFTYNCTLYVDAEEAN